MKNKETIFNRDVHDNQDIADFLNATVFKNLYAFVTYQAGFKSDANNAG